MWTVGKAKWEGSESRRKEVRRSEKKEDAGARKGRKVAIQYVFPIICGSGRSKSRLAKAAGAEPAGQMRDEKLHAVVARSTFPSQNVQNTPCSGHFFGSWDAKKVYAVVARSTFPSQNVQNTPCSGHFFWKLRCQKSVRRCGAKHISKSKCAKHATFGPLLEVQMPKKVHTVVARSTFPSQNVRVRTTFGSWDAKKVYAVVARSTFPSQNIQNWVFWAFFDGQMSKRCTLTN